MGSQKHIIENLSKKNALVASYVEMALTAGLPFDELLEKLKDLGFIKNTTENVTRKVSLN